MQHTPYTWGCGACSWGSSSFVAPKLESARRVPALPLPTPFAGPSSEAIMQSARF
jgi:hypothetical protein